MGNCWHHEMRHSSEHNTILVGNHFRGSIHLCTHYCCTLPPTRHLESANEAMAPVFSNKFMDGDVFSHHICSLSLSASREGWGHVSHDRCHVSLVPCHSVTAAECGHGHN